MLTRDLDSLGSDVYYGTGTPHPLSEDKGGVPPNVATTFEGVQTVFDAEIPFKRLPTELPELLTYPLKQILALYRHTDSLTLPSPQSSKQTRLVVPTNTMLAQEQEASHELLKKRRKGV